MSSVSSKRFSIRSRTRGDFRNEKIDDDDDNNIITYNMIPATADTLRVLFSPRVRSRRRVVWVCGVRRVRW